MGVLQPGLKLKKGGYWEGNETEEECGIMGIRAITFFFLFSQTRMSQKASAHFPEADEMGYFYVNCTLSASPVIL